MSQGGLTTLPCVFPSQDESVTHLGQELAQKLGLRVRKAYKRPQVGGPWALGPGRGWRWGDLKRVTRSLWEMCMRGPGPGQDRGGDSRCSSLCWLKALGRLPEPFGKGKDSQSF